MSGIAGLQRTGLQRKEMLCLGCRMREVDVKDILDALQLKHDQNSERPAHST